jgi:hypothetical protein
MAPAFTLHVVVGKHRPDGASRPRQGRSTLIDGPDGRW